MKGFYWGDSNVNNLKNKYSSVITVVAVAFLVIAVVLLSAVAINYVTEARYIERKNYLKAQMNTTSTLVNKLLERYVSYSKTNASIIESSDLSERDVCEYLKINSNYFFLMGSDLILVDDAYNYYKTDGTTGRITEPDSYASDTPTSAIYMAHHVDDVSDSIVFRTRLFHPVVTHYGDKEITVSYCALVYYMDNMEREINSMFPFEGNRFIIDRDGFMLYQNTQLGFLISGTNVLSKYNKVDFLHEVSGASLKNQILARVPTVGEFVLDYTNYFVSSSPLQYNGWSIVFVVESDFLASGQYINTIFKYLVGIASIFVVVIISVFALVKSLEDNQDKLEFIRKTNDNLEKVSRAKSEFLSNMSHDIRTPINAIIGMTLLARKQLNPKRTDECLDNIEQSSSHLLSLINDVLDMSSIESGKSVLNLKSINLYMIADECSSIIKGQILNRSLDFHTEFCEPFSWVYGDGLKIKQILINILSNSVKYTLDGGSITFSMDLLAEDFENCTVRFTISDTGIGMKPEFVNKIWDAFSQEDGGSRSSYIGTGLGMAITKKYVDLMGGTITVDSELYKGSTFTVTLQFKKAPAEKNTLPLHHSDSIEGAKILLVEDNKMNMLVASELLEDEKAIITKAYNGKEALDIFTNSLPGDFDVIIMDIMMPEMDGLECTRAIRALNRSDATTIPIVAMTANAFESDIQRSKEAGMNAHLSKPMNLREVLSTLSRFYKN